MAKYRPWGQAIPCALKAAYVGLNTLLNNGEQNPVDKLLVLVLSTLADID